MLHKKIVIDKANRLYQMPPDILSFLSTDHQRQPLLKRANLIDLASFKWPLAHDEIDLSDKADLRPADDALLKQLKEALAGWFEKHHGIKLNPLREIYIGGGITRLIFQLSLGYIENGDVAFVPELSVPLYRKAVIACNGEPISYAISPKNNWQPNFERLNSHLGRVARLLILNSPHNPTGVELNEKELAELILIASRENILIVNDAAYQSLPGRKPLSLLSVTGGKKVGVEAYSFSYLLGLPYLPYGFLVGNREVINVLSITSGLMPEVIPAYFVKQAISALRHYPGPGLKKVRQYFNDAAVGANQVLSKLSLEKISGNTIPFLWTEMETRGSATTLARQLYRRYRILIVPGTVFGESGQGFLRISLTPSAEEFTEAAGRLKKRINLLMKKTEE